MQNSRAALAALARLLPSRDQLLAASVDRQLSTLCGLGSSRTSAALQGSAGSAGATWVAMRHCGRPAASSAHLAWLRSLSTSAEEAAAKEAVEDTLRPRILRLFAFFMICSAGLNVAPHIAAASVGNCLALLDAQQPFMVKAGCSRLQLLTRLDAARERAVQEGAVHKLLRVVQRPHDDPGVADYALSALEALAGCSTGLAALAEAGGQAALQAYISDTPRSPETEDALHRAKRLLALLAAPAMGGAGGEGAATAP